MVWNMCLHKDIHQQTVFLPSLGYFLSQAKRCGVGFHVMKAHKIGTFHSAFTRLQWLKSFQQNIDTSSRLLSRRTVNCHDLTENCFPNVPHRLRKLECKKNLLLFFYQIINMFIVPKCSSFYSTLVNNLKCYLITCESCMDWENT